MATNSLLFLLTNSYRTLLGLLYAKRPNDNSLVGLFIGFLSSNDVGSQRNRSTDATRFVSIQDRAALSALRKMLLRFLCQATAIHRLGVPQSRRRYRISPEKQDCRLPALSSQLSRSVRSGDRYTSQPRSTGYRLGTEEAVSLPVTDTTRCGCSGDFRRRS